MSAGSARAAVDTLGDISTSISSPPQRHLNLLPASVPGGAVPLTTHVGRKSDMR
jgi:hypothetical protein